MSVAMLGCALLMVVGCGAERTSPLPAATGGPFASSNPTASDGASTPSPSVKPSDGSKAGNPDSARATNLPKGVSTQNAKDPLAPKTIKQVARDGRPPHPKITTVGRSKPFNKSITYEDGLRLTVTKMTQGRVTGHGPGVYPGRPVTMFYLSMVNGTKTRLDLGVVVVTVTYGSPARVAHAIYDPQSVDFSGVIQPGEKASAAYGFSVPKGARSHVTMTVDIDGRHHLAVFRGSVN